MPQRRRIIEQFVIAHAQHLETHGCTYFIAQSIVFRLFSVVRTVQFDYETAFQAIATPLW